MKKSQPKLPNDNEISYRALFEQAGDAIFRGDNNGNFTQVNSAACKLTGFTQKELLSMNMKNLFIVTELYNKPLQYKKLDDNKSIISERNILTKSGKSIPIEMNSKRVDSNSYLSIIRDISYRKKIEKKLKYNEEKFRTLFSAAPDGILLLNNKGLIIDCNQAYCNLLKSNRKDIINTHVSDSICENDKTQFLEKYPNLISTGKAEGELCLITKENDIINTRRSASALYNEKGKYTGAIVHTHNITEQKKARNEIEKREARLNAIFNAADNISFILTTAEATNAKILEFSPGSEKIFGYKRDDIIGQPITLLHTHESIKNFSSYLDKMHLGIEGFKGESIMIKKSGIKITVLHTAYPIFDSTGKLSQLLAVTIDISKQKLLESQLYHSQRMEAIGHMASGITHNFNNILQAIVGYIGLAKEGLQTNNQRFKDIDQINQHVKRASILIKELSSVGKDQNMIKDDVNLADIINPIIDLIVRTSHNKIYVNFDYEDHTPIISADKDLIDQVIRNIIINAKDSISNNGVINITCDKVIIDDLYCSKNPWAKQGEYVLTCISDTGHGMNQETISQIFDPFFTTKDPSMGTGLGLSTSFSIISQHKGLINVTSEISKGSTFEIYLPI